MKTHIFILACLFLGLSTTRAQLCNHPNGFIRTNPDNYTNPNDPNALLKWDWRGNQIYSFYIYNLQNNQTYQKQVKSPFFFPAAGNFTSQLNINHYWLQSVKDYEPSEGWELVMKNFGTQANPVEAPTFVLYNRYRSLLRVFCYIEYEEYPNDASIELTFNTNTTYISHNLNHSEPYENTLDKRIYTIRATALNSFENNMDFECRVELINNIGNVIQKTLVIPNEEKTFDLSSYSNGQYILRITGYHKTVIQKIILNK